MDQQTERAITNWRAFGNQMSQQLVGSAQTGVGLSNFSELDNQYIREAVSFIASVDPVALTVGPSNELPIIMDLIDRLRDIVDKISRFNPMNIQQGTPSSTRDALMHQIRDTYDELTRRIAIPLALHNARAGSQRAGAVQQELAAALAELRSAQTEVNAVVKSVKDAAAAVGTAAFSKVFQDEARKYGLQSVMWFILVAVLVAVGATLGIKHLYSNDLLELKKELLVGWVAVRLFTLSIFFLVLTFVLKNFLAARHNAVVNRHRACTLQVFEALRDSAKDDSTKNAVLMAACSAMFSAQGSGYLKGESEDPPVKQFFEVMLQRQGGFTS